VIQLSTLALISLNNKSFENDTRCIDIHWVLKG